MGPDRQAAVGRAAPIPNSYWVPGHALAAGEYPGALAPDDARAKVARLLDHGIDVFIDLTEPADRLAPYAGVLEELAGKRGLTASLLPCGMPDMSIPSPDRMRRTLDLVDESLSGGRTVYVHCWGGVGRTGTVVGCFLVRRGMSGDEALQAVAKLFATMSPQKVARHLAWGSPQTDEQREMVRAWAQHERGTTHDK